MANKRSIIVETVKEPSSRVGEVVSISDLEDSWATPILKFINGYVPADPTEFKLLARRAANFTIING
jgi:hypothetical protein